MARGVTEPVGTQRWKGWGEHREPPPCSAPRPLTGEEYRPLLPSRETSLRILSTALSPLDYRKWRRKPWYWRLFKAFKVRRGGHEPGGDSPAALLPLGLCPPGVCSGDGGTDAVGLGAGPGARRRVSQLGITCPRCPWSWCCCSLFLWWTLTRMT